MMVSNSLLSFKRAWITAAVFSVIILTGLWALDQNTHKVIQNIGDTHNHFGFPAGVPLTLKMEQSFVSGAADTTKDSSNPMLKNSNSGVVDGAATNRIIGIYESASPRQANSLARLKEISEAGFNLVVNYSILDGSKQDITHYLDMAESLGVKVLFSIKDFYDIEANDYINLSDFSEYGTNNDQIVAGIVQTYKDHPALYGWYISDERPEAPSDSNKWMPALKDRYQLIKQKDPSHPTLIILGCYQGENVASWPPALTRLIQATDAIGFDSYPVPYAPLSIVQQCSQTISNAVTNSDNRWFVIQGFSWSSYPEVVKQDGSDITKARYPTLNELKEMINSARNAGINNILVYSYFDLKNDSTHFAATWQNLRQAIAETRN